MGHSSLALVSGRINLSLEYWVAALEGYDQVYYVSGNITDDDANELAALENLLDGLAIIDLGLSPNGARAIAEGLPQLTTLDLDRNGVGEVGARAIAEGLPQLTTLNLWDNEVGEAGARAIAEGLPQLTTLNLWDNGVGEVGARAIAEGLPQLTTLNLWDNGVGEVGARAIAEGLPQLTTLTLDLNRVGEAGARAIAEGLPQLTTLHLDFNGVGEAGARAIAEGLPQLTTLHLNRNGVGEAGARAIAEGLPQLTTLHLDNNGVGEAGARAIAEGLPQLTTLHLDNNGVGEAGARAIAEGLPQLTTLNLNRNGVGDDGARAIAEGLPQLTTLNLNNNGVGDDGARAIAEGLPQLTTLHLNRNGVGDDGARAIAEGLSQLTTLHLNRNGVGEVGARAIAEGLPQLTTLNLWDNGVGEVGARAIAEGLPQLTTLNLNNNEVGDAGAVAVLEAWSTRADLPTDAELDLGQNQLITVLPDEVLATINAQSLLAAFRRFAVERDDLVALNEAKMLVVGEEGVGKTSLVRFLTEDKPRRGGERRTEGAALHERIETVEWSDTGSDVAVNIWDFGGQEILQGTHRFFLTRRSLYLLVLSNRFPDRCSETASDWMRTIKNRGGESPVIIVVNGCDNGEDHNLSVNFTTLREEYPEIIDVVTTSCEDEPFGYESVARLRDRVARTLTDQAVMPFVSEKVPRSWLRIKNQIADLAEERHFLPRQDFVDLCLADETTIELDGEHEALLETLHNLGVIVYHRRETQVLEPNWLTSGIYAVLNAKSVRDANGEFDKPTLAGLLPPGDYPPDVHDYIIDMMEADDIGMCFALRDRPGRYLVPEALPSNEPDLGPPPTDALRLRYKYDFLPHHVIPRFIVETHDYLTNQPTAWQTGVVLHTAGCRIVARGNRDRKTLELTVTGPPDRRREALATVTSRLKVVHDLNKEIVPDARVPAPDNPNIDVSHAHLITLENQHGPDFTVAPEGGDGKTYSVRELLQGIKLDTTPPVTVEPTDTPDPPAPEPEYERPWSINAIAAGVAAMVAAGVVIAVGFWANQPRLALALAAVFGFGAIVTAFVWRANPKMRWHRRVSYTLGAGFGMHALGFATEIGARNNNSEATFRWDGAVGTTLTIVWGVIVTVLIIAALINDLSSESQHHRQNA